MTPYSQHVFVSAVTMAVRSVSRLRLAFPLSTSFSKSSKSFCGA